MLNLPAKIRKVFGKKVKKLRKKGILPAILYGPKIKKSLPLEIDYGAFEKVYKKAGESSLISLEIEGKKKKLQVLIQEVKRDPLTDSFLHVDFYQPRLEEEIKASIPLIFEGTSKAVKELGGTLVKNISEIEVKVLPKDLPREIKVDIGPLKTFDDRILIGDLKLPKGVEVLRKAEEIVAFVSPPEKVEEEKEAIEEKVEKAEKITEEEK